MRAHLVQVTVERVVVVLVPAGEEGEYINIYKLYIYIYKIYIHIYIYTYIHTYIVL
jgi:hypothetical protein